MQYVVMTTAVRTPDGKNCTGSEHVYSVDSILKKYLRYASFFAGDSIVSLLVGTQSRFDKYQMCIRDRPFYLHVAYTAPHAPWLNNHPKAVSYTHLVWPASAAASAVQANTKQRMRQRRIEIP